MVLTPTTRAADPSGLPSPLILAHPPPIRRFSTSSFSKLSDFHLDDAPLPTRQPSYASLSGEGSGVKGVRFVDLSLDPSEWRHPIFKKKVLAILRRLRVARWESPDILPSYLHLQKVSGALTNAVFFVSFNPSKTPTSPSMSPLLTPTMPPSDPDLPLTPERFPPTLLLRIYGPNSDALISRTEELRILHVLCTQYNLGPTVYGTFDNGRVEEFFPSRALTADELRDPLVSRGIARRMRELHSVDMHALGYESPQPTLWKCLEEWVPLATEVLTTLSARGGKWEILAEAYSLHTLAKEIDEYWQFVIAQGPIKPVFCHNDTQYGNLLKLDTHNPGAPDHHQYIVIDFEYAAPNARGYDIANHFHEWRANYHHPTLSHSLQPHYPYPSPAQRENFYRAYLSITVDKDGDEVLGKRKDVEVERVERLEREVRVWSPACSVFWALWGVIQAEEQIAKIDEQHEFDYLAYALERLEMFRQEAKELGAL